jgi:hypothetical protein
VERIVLKFFKNEDGSSLKFLTIVLLYMFFNKDSKLVQIEEGKEFDFDEYFNEQCILAAKHESDVIILKLRENSLTIP